MKEIRVTGGVRIGWVNATWPLARLDASATCLKLSSVLDTYVFLPSEVVSLDRYGSILFFASGVRIAHARSDYPSKIIFWCPGKPEKLIKRIRGTGFSPTAPASSETKHHGFPFRWMAILFIFLALNGLFLLDGAIPRSFAVRAELLTLIPLLLAFLTCWGIKTSPKLQKMMLRDGHSVNEIKAFLSLVQTLSGILLAVFAVLVLTHTIR